MFKNNYWFLAINLDRKYIAYFRLDLNGRGTSFKRCLATVLPHWLIGE